MSRRSCAISSIDAAGAPWNGQPEARAARQMSHPVDIVASHLLQRLKPQQQISCDSPLERAGFEPLVPGESGFDFAREVRGRLFAGERWIRNLGSGREGLRFEPLSVAL
jgi:hypothetical protein